MYRTVSTLMLFGATAAFLAAQHPAPFVDELSPSALKVGALNSIVTLKGTGFAPDSVVRWQVDGTSTRLVTFFKSPTNLEAEIPFWLTAVSRTATLTVENPGSTSSHSVSNSTLLPITVPTGSVALAETSFGVGDNPNRIVSGDFNGDGNIDIVTTNSLSNDVSILLGDGSGGFHLGPVSPAVGAFPVALASGDFNGDGKLDLAVANLCTTPASCPDNGTVTILLNHGDGTFSPAITTALSSQPAYVAVGDFNRDGKLDLAVAQADKVAILLGKNDGSFTTSSSPALPAGATQVVVGDFNGDGDLDLAVVSAQWAVLLGKGNGAFGAPIPLAWPPSGAFQMVTGDFNHDGRLDLVITFNSPSLPPVGYVSALLGNGNGTFTTGPTSLIGSFGVGYMLPGDFNGDGKLDLAMNAAYPLIDYAVVLGKGDGSFALSTMLMVSHNGNGPPAIGDFNGDGRLDIAAPNDTNGGEVAILIQQPVATLSDTALKFGDQNRGSRTTRSATLTAGAALHMAGIANFGPFGLETTYTSCPYHDGTLAAGKSCTIDVQFDPAGSGSFVGFITLTDDSGGVAGSQQTIALSGSGH